METQSPAGKPLHPLVWAAGIALIVFSAVGIGAFMGWIPNSMGTSGSEAALDPDPASAVVTPASPPLTSPAPLAEPVPPVPRAAPARRPVVAEAPRGVPTHASARCAECGVIESVHEIDTKGSGSGIGAVGGAVAGGLLGHEVGGGKGKNVMAVVGAVGGALAGNEIEKRVKSTKGYAITVRFEDGSTRVINQSAAPAWRTGDKVRIVDGAIEPNP